MGTPIKDWAEDDKPREKLMQKGAEALSNSELLAILIATGTVKRSALDLAKDLLTLGKNDLSALGRISVKEMMAVNGIGPAKAITLAAALELGRRRATEAPRERDVIGKSSDVARYLQTKLGHYSHEVFAVFFLNQANKVNHFEIISEGGITGTVADPRIILRKALAHEAVNLILCHNHPSGSLRPSRADEELTLKIRDAARSLDIKVLDHIIVSDEGYYSFADEGLM